MKNRNAFYILVGCALCIRLFYVFFMPTGQTVRFRIEGLNDEPSHLNYVHYLAEHDNFPVQTHHAREADSFVRNEFEYYQAPAYYVLGAGIERLFGKSNILFLCRMLSFVFGVLTFFTLGKIFRLLSFDKMAADAVVLFAAFFPAHAYFCSVVSNDSMSWFIAAILTLLLVRATLTDETATQKTLWFLSLQICVILTIGIYTKSSLFLFVPIILLLPIYKAIVLHDRRWILPVICATAFTFASVVPWHLRNAQLYGSFFAIDIGNGPAQFFLFTPHAFVRFVKLALFSFWYPMQNVPPSHAVSGILVLEAIVLIVNTILLTRYFLNNRKIMAGEIVLGILLLLNMVAYIKYNLYWDNNDGRFFFPSLAALCFVFCVPLYQYCKKTKTDAFFIGIVCAESLFPYINLLLA